VARVVLARSFSGEAKRLAWISSGDDVDMGDGAPIYFGDVPEVRDVGPMFFQYATRERVYFGVPFNGHPSPL
jgi:hypothetical protein